MQTHQQPKLDIPPRTSSIYPEDVSPPDSPRPGDGARNSSPNVSPITDAGSGHRLSSSSRPFISNIPLPKQKASGGTAAFISNWREKLKDAQSAGTGKMKWDDYSGEPTGSDRGKMGQVVPGSTKFDKPALGVVTTVTSQPLTTKSLFGTTLRKVPRKEEKSLPSPPPKEEWKGASGRAPIIAPVQIKPDPRGTNKSFPTPSQRRQKQGVRQPVGIRSSEDRSSPAQGSGKSSPQQAVERGTPTKLAEVAEEFDRSPPNGSRLGMEEQEYTESPVVIPARADSMGVFDRALGQGDPLPSSKDIPEIHQQVPAVRKVTTEPVAKKPLPPETSTRTTSLPPSNEFLEEQLHNAVRNLDLHNEPASRFSATTYNTTIQESPDTPKPSFEEPDLPAPVPDSILNRKRPVPTAGSFGRSKPPSRKPTPSELGNIESDGKALPQQPEEETIVDRVVLLEAKLNSLYKRKQNLQTVIHELTNVVQPSSVAYDNASREEIRKTVEGLQTESATVVKEIHETGLKLHRALKKRDESASYEPTGLWVRRVTG